MLSALALFLFFFFDFSSIFGTPEPWKSVLFLGKTTIFKKTTFWQKWPQGGPQLASKPSHNEPKMPKKSSKCPKRRIFESPKNHWKKRTEKSWKKGPWGLNLTSRGNGKRNEKSDGTMLPSAAVCGNWYDHAVISCCAWELTFEAWSLRL